MNVSLNATQKVSIGEALERRRRVNNGEYALTVYIPLEDGRQYTSFAGKIVEDLQRQDIDLLAAAYLAIADDYAECKLRLSSEIDVDADQILAMAGRHWVDEKTKTVHSDNRKLKKALKAVLASAGDDWKMDGNVGHRVSVTLTVRELRALRDVLEGEVFSGG